MSAELPAAADPAAGSADVGVAAAPPGFWERLSDRLNPILVREVQQAVKGRMFALTVLGSLLVSVVIAISVASQRRLEPGDGNMAFRAVLMTFCPVALFLVPLSAYGSMRHELRAGIVEQLLLSRLRPWRIVVGKMTSALVQFVLYLSVFAPVLSMTYLLRGVDLPTIALCLFFGMLFSLVATTFAIAAAAQVVFPSLQVVSNIGMVAALGAATVAMMSAVMQPFLMRELTQLVRHDAFWTVFSAVALLGLAAVVLCAMVAAAMLAHGYENKSTGFRIYLLVVACGLYGWIAWCVPGASAGMPPGRSALEEILPGSAMALSILGGVFGVFMVGETERLSPRVREKAPRRPLAALLLAPLLPGRGRGLLFALAFQVLVIGIAAAWLWIGGMGFRRDWRLLGFVVCYVAIYLGLTKLVRGLLPETALAGMATRVIAPAWLILGCAVPAIFDGVLGGGIGAWHPGHLLNPFWTIDRFARPGNGAEALGLLAALALLVVLPQLGSMLRGVTEVIGAHDRRRPLAAAAEDAGAT